MLMSLHHSMNALQRMSQLEDSLVYYLILNYESAEIG